MLSATDGQSCWAAPLLLCAIQIRVDSCEQHKMLNNVFEMETRVKGTTEEITTQHETCPGRLAYVFNRPNHSGGGEMDAIFE